MDVDCKEVRGMKVGRSVVGGEVSERTAAVCFVEVGLSDNTRYCAVGYIAVFKTVPTPLKARL